MFFVDANVVIYAVSQSRYQSGALAVMAAVRDGAPGATSAMVLEEVWHLEQSGRIPCIEATARDAFEMFDTVLPVTAQVLATAFALDVKELGTADLIHVATCINAGITDIVTADRAFDRAPGIRRIDLLDEIAVEQLRPG
jgi:predicted nucleic acid-binding protein